MTWGTIIVIIIALWGVISQVLEAAAKKAKEKKRIEEMQQRAAREAGATVQQPAQAGGTFTMSPQEPEGGHPGHAAEVGTPSTMAPPTPYRPARQPTRAAGGESDLAARRRAQLEQLRQRRGATIDPRLGTRMGGGQQQPAAAPRPIPPATGRPQAPKIVRRPARQPGTPATGPLPPQRGRSAGVRAGRPGDLARQAAAGRTARTVDDLITSIEASKAAVEPQDAYSLPTMSQGLAAAGGRSGQGTDIGALRSLLGDASTLRQVFLAKELLDAPVSLRTDPEPGYLAG